MSCPTCDHTMRHIIEGLWWCGRCGTITVIEEDETESSEAPKLVERCRKFEHEQLCEPPYPTVWRTMGIAEAVNKPEDRPQ